MMMVMVMMLMMMVMVVMMMMMVMVMMVMVTFFALQTAEPRPDDPREAELLPDGLTLPL